MGKGTWSDALQAAVAKDGVKALPVVRIGGPTGRFSINPAHFEHIVLVCGGIGVTPLLSLLSDIVDDVSLPDTAEFSFSLSEPGVVSPPVAATKPAAAAPVRRYPALKRVDFVWTVRNADCLTWFAAELAAATKAKGITITTHIYVTGKASPTAADEGGVARVPHATGRPNVAAIVASAASAGAPTVGVYACGPAQLLESTEDAVIAANALGKAKVFKHEEIFIW